MISERNLASMERSREAYPVPEPLAFLEDAGRLLRPGGKLFLNVPDLDSLPARLLGERAGLKLVGLGRRMVWFSPARLPRSLVAPVPRVETWGVWER